MNPLQKLAEYGQAIWLDDIHRDLMTSGQLKRLIEEDGLRGMTSNPAIFQKAISDNPDYSKEIRALADQGKSGREIYDALSLKDVQMAADVFRPLYDRTDGQHGFVSLEVDPHLAHDTERTVAEARRLWKGLDRPNVFIKVPGTREGLPAIEQLIGEGINVNVTLLFGLPRYREVAQAYRAGLEKRAKEGQPLGHVRSVASFFLSRIDVLLDPKLEEISKAGGENAEIARRLHGQLAIASAKQAYQIYKEWVAAESWQQLARQGAHPQWLLWASTSTKNPDYSDVKYVEALIGPETVNTLPMETLEAYRDHGQPAPRLEEEVEPARKAFELLPQVGLQIDAATQQLEDEGVEKFIKPFDRLLETLAKQMATA